MRLSRPLCDDGTPISGSPPPRRVGGGAGRGAAAARLGLIVASGLLVGLAVACASAPVDQSRNQCEEGVRAADAGRWEEAEFRWLKALAIDRTSACAHNNLAVRHEREGRFDEAEGSYGAALEHATGDLRRVVTENWNQFRVGRGEEGATEEAASGEAVAGVPARTVEVTVAVPEAEGRDLANFERILVGNFVITENDTGISLNALAVRYFRRRLVQRTFFQAVDLLAEPFQSTMEDPLEDRDLWVARAEEADADLIFTGRIGAARENTSRLVTEVIRAPSGEETEVSRFREFNSYRVTLEYVLLRGDDGNRLREGSLEAAREFAADQNVGVDEALQETLEELLPQVLDAITPQRTEETRLLVY